MSDLSLKESLSEANSKLRALQGLRNLLQTGGLSDGDPLPSERKLSEEFRVGRTVLRGALDQLRKEGVIRSQGSGRIRVVQAVAGGSNWMRKAIVFLDPMAGKRRQSPAHAYWANFISLGLASAIRASGNHVVALNPNDLEDDDIGRVASDRPMGVIVPEVFRSGGDTFELVQRLSAKGLTVVVYGGHPDLSRFDRVLSDHELGSYHLTQWLIAQGRRRIVQTWPAPGTGYWFAPRRRGYERAIREAGLEPLPLLLSAGVPELEYSEPRDAADTYQFGVRHISGFLIERLNCSEPVDAIMAGTDRDVFYLASACRLLGKQPGSDVLVAGYDNYWQQCQEREFERTTPAATIDKNHDQLAAELVRLLRERVKGVLPDAPQTRCLPPKLVVCDKS